MPGSIRLGSLAGVSISIHLSWFLFGGLLTCSLALVWLPALYPGWPLFLYWGAGVLAVLLLFASVLTHEVAHMWMAQIQGFSVTTLMLFVFGGISNVDEPPTRPRVELQLAYIGPVASLLVGSVFTLLWLTTRQVSSLFGALFGFLAVVNILLGLVNLLPLFPLDGGRVLRSIIWMVTESIPVATRMAALASQGLAVLIILVGLVVLLMGEVLVGIWIAFLGWFLLTGAHTADMELLRETALASRRVEEMMRPYPASVSATMSLQKVVQEYFLRTGQHRVFVTEDDHLIGLLTLADLRHIPQDQWEAIPAHQAMRQEKQIWSVSPHQSIRDALGVMVMHRVNQVPVVEGSHLVGVVNREDLLHAADVRRLLEREMEGSD